MKTRLIIFAIVCALLGMTLLMCTKNDRAQSPVASVFHLATNEFADTIIISITEHLRYGGVDPQEPLPKVAPGDGWTLVVDTHSIVGTFNAASDSVIDTTFKRDPLLKASAYEAIKCAYLFAKKYYGENSYTGHKIIFDSAFVPPVGCDRIGYCGYATIPDMHLPGDTIWEDFYDVDCHEDSVCIRRNGPLCELWYKETRCDSTYYPFYACTDTTLIIKGQFQYTTPQDPVTLLPGIYEIWLKRVGNELIAIREIM